MSANGTWNTTINTPMGAQNGTLELNVDGSDLSGKMSSPQGEMAIENGAIDGEELEDGFVEACLGGEPDPEVLRFLRLSLLEGPDAFLLEPIFANTFAVASTAADAGAEGGV